MLVYCTTLWLACDLDHLLEIIAAWLSEKTDDEFTADTLRRPQSIKYDNRDTLRVFKWDVDYPKLYSIAHQYPDRDASGKKVNTGRLWTTEIGIRQTHAEDPIECSILVSTYEVSTRVNARTQLTCPELVPRLLRHCSPTLTTPGAAPATLHEREADVFWDLIQDPQRQHPLVLVSPTRDGEYALDLQLLRREVCGIADLVVISRKANTFTLAEKLGNAYMAWNGAVNVIFPRQRDQLSFPTRRLKIEDIEALTVEPVETFTLAEKRVSEVLSIVTHRVNLPNSWRHISPQVVNQVRLRREMETRRDEALKKLEQQFTSLSVGVSPIPVVMNGDIGLAKDDEYVSRAALLQAEAVYKQVITDLEVYYERQRLEAQEEKDQLEMRLLELDDRLTLMTSRTAQQEYIEQLQAQIDALQARLANKRATQTHTDGVIAEALRTALANTIEGNPTPTEALMVVEYLYPERITILDSAWQSAEEAAAYKYRDVGFELLWKLATRYWEALQQGKGDAEARNIFGMNKYSAKESETVSSNRRARLLRTFRYKGEDIYMEKHLRDNTNPSVVETIRIHFHWDAEDRRIVIGHCGKHLDHN